MANLPPPPFGVTTDSFEYQDWFTKIKAMSGGGGGGGVSSISAGTNITITGTSTNPIINASSSSGITSISGDISAAGTGAVVATLPNVNSTPGGTYNNFTVNAKGLVTASSFQEYVPVFGTQQSITPSTDPFFANVSLLYHFNDNPGTTTPLDTSNYAHTVNYSYSTGVFTTQTTQKKFGSAAWQATGSTQNRLQLIPAVPVVNEFSMGTGDFTAEGWFYFNSVSGNSYYLMGCGGAGGGTNWGLILLSTAKIAYLKGGSPVLTGTTAVTVNTWHHVAVVRSSGVVTLYFNGVSQGTLADSANYTINTCEVFGNSASTGVSLNGYGDEIRITKGVARYSGAFTPPTSEFPSPTYPTTGPRMTDDFSNALISNRYIFQSSVVNGITDVGATPNGTSTNASYTVYNNSDVNNAGYFQFSSNPTVSTINSSFYGAGTANPISIQIAGTEFCNISPTTLSFAGVGKIITGDLSNTDISSHLRFQSTATGLTQLVIAPNSTTARSELLLTDNNVFTSGQVLRLYNDPNQNVMGIDAAILNSSKALNSSATRPISISYNTTRVLDIAQGDLRFVSNVSYPSQQSFTPASGSATTTLIASNNNFYTRTNATSSSGTITLFSGTTALLGRVLGFSKTDSTANTVTITAAAGNTINGVSSLVLSSQYSHAWMVLTSSTTWEVIYSSGVVASVIKTGIKTVTAAYSVVSSDGTILADTTTTAYTITLPTPSSVTGQVFVIKNFPPVAANVHNLTISGSTIDYTPSGSFILSSAGSSVTLQSNGTIYLTI